MPIIKEKKKKRVSIFSVLASILLLLLISTNIATVVVLHNTSIKLSQILTENATLQKQINELNNSDEDVNTSAPVTEPQVVVPAKDMLSYAQMDGVSLEFIQRFFNDRILVWENRELKSIPIDETLKKNYAQRDNISTSENGRKEYIVDGENVGLTGVDVSSYQGNINWSKVAADGIDYAFIRLGFRGYGTGKLMLDTQYHLNMRGANAQGMPVGVYFYSQAINVEEAIEEAHLVLNNIKDYKVDYPVVFDMEVVDNDTARTDDLTTEERTAITIAFCEEIKNAGYTPMIYGNIHWMAVALDLSQLEDYDKWFAQYFKQPFFPYEYSIWQYTARGTVNGIEGNVDLNIAFKNHMED